jgi:eukaryotic-like serine/threonine-protein kinase
MRYGDTATAVNPGCVVGELLAGRYELVDALGQGGTGSVWRAWDHRAGYFVAAKVLRQSDAVSLLRFVREQSLRIDHPHVVKPNGWAGEDDRVLFTMPLIRGGSVATLLDDFHTLPVPWAALLLDQLLDALGAVHAAGVVHRDVKPANLLLEPTGLERPHLWLSDFGVAVPVCEPRLTRVDMVHGTPGYLSPERLAGADPDPRSDLYAAGVVAVEMLSGERPDAGDRKGDADRLLANQPDALRALLERLLARDPADRPASAGQARADLAATGFLPPPGQPPGDDGAAIEVFDHLPELPDDWQRPPPSRQPGSGATPDLRQASPDHLSAVASTPPLAPPGRAPVSSRPVASPPQASSPVPRPAPNRRWRTMLYGSAVLALLGGVVLLVAALVVFMR